MSAATAAMSARPTPRCLASGATNTSCTYTPCFRVPRFVRGGYNERVTHSVTVHLGKPCLKPWGLSEAVPAHSLGSEVCARIPLLHVQRTTKPSERFGVANFRATDKRLDA